MYIQENTPGISLALSGASKGDALKWYQPAQNCYIKANRIDHGREYQDSIAEVIAARVGALLHIEIVPYTLCRIRLGRWKVYSWHDFTEFLLRERNLPVLRNHRGKYG